MFRVLAWAAALTTAGCGTLSIPSPLTPPPDSWDPARNTHPDSAEFIGILDRYVQNGLPGAVLWVRTPEGLWNGAAGYAKVETGDPMLPSHRFPVASVTKMFMATAVMVLVEEGLLDLEAPIRSYLPEEVWRFVPNGSEARIRDLLNHRSGILDFSRNPEYSLDFMNNPMGAYPPEKILSYLHGQPPWSTSGQYYFYSNSNYFLLALIVDEVTGGSHADVITNRILEPLGLDGTHYRAEESYPEVPGLVNSYQDLAGDGRLINVSDLTAHAMTIFFGNAGLISTSADLAGFIEGLMGGDVVGEAALREMQDFPEDVRYGLGLNLLDTPYGPGLGHDGGDRGAQAKVRHFPARDATLVLLSNAGDDGVPGRLFNGLWQEAVEAALSGTGRS